ncbi:short-chain dehydrogenase/reductase SDR [Chytridium lagenaria]|nr:short-chain dehydrogenase/reductase SDR [Chytridium lagenaria]
MASKKQRTIFITGGSSGIGRYTAISYAERYATKMGKTHGLTLVLTARRVEKLREVKEEIGKSWPDVKVEIAQLDVTDTQAVFTVFKEVIAKVGNLDVVLVNSGVGDGWEEVGGYESQLSQERCIKTNVIGAMATVNAAVEHMKEVGGGQIVAVGSVAAFRGVPGIAAYGASKAALNTYMEAIRHEVAPYNIKTSIIHPGFIDTDINKDVPNRPFLITGRKGGEIVVKHIERKTAFAVIPFFPWAFVVRLMIWLPGWVIRMAWGSEIKK